jgi:PAS domain-containing protein
MLKHAAVALALEQHSALALLDVADAPTYVTNEDGIVVYANEACEPFAGRTPVLGEDRWCVSWKLYTDAGAFLPHEECPMAVAIREQKPVRNASAVAERPDGTRVPFRPFPTPIFGRDGQLVGAVNVLMPY